MKHFRNLLYMGLAAALCAPAYGAAPEGEASTVVVEFETIRLAELRYDNKLRIVFTYHEPSGDFAMIQQGPVGVAEPIPRGVGANLLDMFLAVTPEDVAVPELLLAEERTKSTELPAKLGSRRISPDFFRVEQLQLPARAKNFYYPSPDWSEGPGDLPNKTYQSSYRYRYVDSYLENTTVCGAATWESVRHRIFFYNLSGQWEKHHDVSIPPGHWEAVTKGGLHPRYRKVYYTKNWSSCGNCDYVREGGFREPWI